MEKFIESPDQYLATASQILSVTGRNEAADIIRRSTLKVTKTGFDSWNGGTEIWTFYFQIPPMDFGTIIDRGDLEAQISEVLKSVIEPFTQDRFDVKITPKSEPKPDWRHSKSDISQVTRRNIFEGLRKRNVAWNGRLGEIEFLERIYNLREFPSSDSRFDDAEGDIRQHRINNPNDWDDNWVFDDPRFGLLHGTTECFLRFLCEVVHPVVRPNRDECESLVQDFNEQLQLEGWQLVEGERIADLPRYVHVQNLPFGRRAVVRAHSVADALDASWMRKEVSRLENSLDDDPALAIGTAKDVIETCCKTVLTKRNVPFSKSATLTNLTKLVTKELALVPEDISDAVKGSEIIRVLLGNLASITKSMAELRGLYGNGHGKDGAHRGLQARHARLAVGAAITFVEFVVETYRERERSLKK